MKIFELVIFGIHIAPTYYGLMYALGFIGGYWIIQKRLSSGGLLGESKYWISEAGRENIFFYIFAGVILGGRLGYILFYNLGFYLHHPLDILKIWEGGMSFHGGVMGVIVAMIVFAWQYKINFYRLADEIAAVVPIGLGLGRIGNYLNQELLGFSPYDGWLAVYKGGIGYFPSPLVEACGEGLILFLILNYIYKKRKFYGQIGALFLIGYSIVRMGVEFFLRTPDSQIGYILPHISLGLLLTLPMFIVGVIIYTQQKKHSLFP